MTQLQLIKRTALGVVNVSSRRKAARSLIHIIIHTLYVYFSQMLNREPSYTSANQAGRGMCTVRYFANITLAANVLKCIGLCVHMLF